MMPTEWNASMESPTSISNNKYANGECHSKKREIYRFEANWLLSSVAWSNDTEESFELALTSFIEEHSNRIQLVSLTRDDHNEEIKSVGSFEHPYPATKLQWIPRPAESRAPLPRLIATSADYLRLWRLEKNARGAPATNSDSIECDSTNQDTQVKLECLLNPARGLNYCAPITSFDWNDVDPSLIVAASVDSTCSIWDVQSGKLIGATNEVHSPCMLKLSSTPESEILCNLRTKILAHNSEVYDVSFSRAATGRDVFVTAGGDGSIRQFDLRRLDRSTVLYDHGRDIIPCDSAKAFLRVACNMIDANYVSAFARDSKDIIVIDCRSPGRPAAVLGNHTADLNSMSWAPHSAHHICSASEDRQALIWELSKLPNSIDEPLLAYRANGRINSIDWSASQPDWIAICYENYLELLRV